eukprot:scaffold5502_cov115-Cylindrotheca_fusiformis.AAC.4
MEKKNFPSSARHLIESWLLVSLCAVNDVDLNAKLSTTGRESSISRNKRTVARCLEGFAFNSSESL